MLNLLDILINVYGMLIIVEILYVKMDIYHIQQMMNVKLYHLYVLLLVKVVLIININVKILI